MFTDMFGNKRYKINFHTHTTVSDGRVSPEESAKVYHQAGYDAIAITDHWVFSAGGTTENLPILSGCEYNFGTDPANDPVYHILAILPDRDPEVERTDSPQVCIDKIIRAGGIPVLAHPAWSLNDPEKVMKLTGIEFTEIHNTVSGKHASNRPYSGAFVDLMACRGTYFGLLATDDTHYYDGDEATASIMIMADSLCPEDLRRALKAGNYYATTGPELHAFVRDGIIEIYCSPCVTVDVFTNACWAKDHHNEGENLTHVIVPLKETDRFVRVEATDKEGRTAYSTIIVIKN